MAIIVLSIPRMKLRKLAFSYARRVYYRGLRYEIVNFHLKHGMPSQNFKIKSTRKEEVRKDKAISALAFLNT